MVLTTTTLAWFIPHCSIIHHSFPGFFVHNSQRTIHLVLSKQSETWRGPTRLNMRANSAMVIGSWVAVSSRVGLYPGRY
ncbi:hypothetical protein BGW80DRAFT_70528 [Lactifluus volemus]|nr:hypothetical protein BGW80DRAFT_70528 [Lactifluus volemus]